MSLKNVSTTVHNAAGFGGFSDFGGLRLPGAVRVSFAPDNEGAGGASDQMQQDQKDQKPAGSGEPSAREKELEEKLKVATADFTRLQTDLKTAQDQLRRFDGIDPDQVRQLLSERQNAQQQDAEKKGDVEALKKILADQHQTEVKSYQDKVALLESQLGKLNGLVADLTVGSAFDSSKFIAGEMVLTPAKARVVYGPYFEAEDGVVVAYDKPRGAENRVKLVDGKGNTMGFEDALKFLVERDPDRDHILRSKMKPGAGSNTTDQAPSKQEPNVRGLSRIALGIQQMRLNQMKK